MNKDNYNSTVLTTSDKYRLYVHVPIVRRKLGSTTELFIEQLQATSSKEAIRQLKRVYCMLDFNRLNRLLLSDAPTSSIDQLLELCGVTEGAAHHASTAEQQGFIALTEAQLHRLDCHELLKEYAEEQDRLTIQGNG